jgi:hypothetical protein
MDAIDLQETNFKRRIIDALKIHADVSLIVRRGNYRATKKRLW